MTEETLPRFHTPVRVRYYETDRQGHLNFIWHQAYFAIAAAEYLKAVGWSYDRLSEEGYDLLFVDAHASFHGPAYYDEELQVHCRAERVGSTSIRFAFITQNPAGRTVSAGDLTAVLVDGESRAKTGVPEAFREAVKEYDS